MLTELGLDVRQGFTTELEFTSAYDVVMCLEYLEQTYEPLADLKIAFQLLQPGGVLYAKTIYLGSPGERESPLRSGFYGAAHFYYYEPATLRSMITAAGFTILEERWQSNATIVALRQANSEGEA
jgi:2-polyprenyl-3-methyl-5-hydroxy-6-metoxy-1,4-benzoquinol methylase